jgi:hypothetical protein
MWIFPVLTGCFLVGGMGLCWLVGHATAAALFSIALSIGLLLPPLGMVAGLLIGNAAAHGPLRSQREMGSFVGTRPVSTAEMARTLLRFTGANVGLAWAIWVLTVTLLQLSISLSTELPEGWTAEAGLRWWHAAALLVAMWTMAAGTASLSLAGRDHLIAKVLLGLFAAVFTPPLLDVCGASSQLATIVAFTLCIAACTVAASATVWAFVAARRRGLIHVETQWLAAGMWVILVCAQCALSHGDPLIAHLMLAGLLTLPVVPLAALPLALAWNRNR